MIASLVGAHLLDNFHCTFPLRFLLSPANVFDNRFQQCGCSDMLFVGIRRDGTCFHFEFLRARITFFYAILTASTATIAL